MTMVNKKKESVEKCNMKNFMSYDLTATDKLDIYRYKL